MLKKRPWLRRSIFDAKRWIENEKARFDWSTVRKDMVAKDFKESFAFN